MVVGVCFLAITATVPATRAFLRSVSPDAPLAGAGMSAGTAFGVAGTTSAAYDYY